MQELSWRKLERQQLNQMNPFNNPQIEIEGLPESEELNYQALEPSYKKVMLISNTIFWAVILTGLTVFFTTIEDIPSFVYFLVPSILTLVISMSYLSIVFGFKNKVFAVRLQDLNYKKGWLWKSRMVVPFKRIQHSEVTQGPVDRFFNLAKLRVFTAGGSGSDLTIPGLKHEEANKLKTLITSRITDKKNLDGREEE